MEGENVLVAVGNIQLEAVLWQNEVANNNETTVIIAHPHPKFGGSMRDHVVKSVFRHLTHLSQFHSVIKFNFRGVGKSTGSASLSGMSEREDVTGIYNYLFALENPPKKCIVIGYSFGSIVACTMTEQLEHCVGFIAISYPLGWLSWFLFWGHYSTMKANKLDKLFITGDEDNFTGISTFESWYEQLQNPKSKVVLKGVNHFYLPGIDKLLEHIVTWLQEKSYITQ